MTYRTGGVTLHTDKQQTTINPDGTVTVFVPITFKRIGGRKHVMSNAEPESRFTDANERDSLVNALLRAFKWQEMIESGKVKTIKQIAEKEGVSAPYVSRIFRMTLLAPDIIEAIISGKQPKTFTLMECMKPFPVEWETQRRLFGFTVASV